VKEFRKHLVNTLRLAGLAAVIFVGLFWGADCRCLGRVSDTLSDVQDKTLDYLSKLEYLRFGPSIPDGVPPVRLIQLDDATVSRYSADSYVFNRGALTKVLEALEDSQPRAVFIDMDLSRATNESVRGKPQRSSGDQALIAFLKRASFPVLFTSLQPLEKSRLFGSSPEALGIRACFVTPNTIRDQDSLVRRIPRRVSEADLLPASEGLYRAARGEDACPSSREARARSPYAFQDTYGGIGNRMIFRQPEFWQGLTAIPALDVLDSDTLNVFDDAIVLIGRTDRESGDELLTPVGRIPGVLVHVNELMTILSYGRKVAPLSPFWGALLAFAFTFASLLVTPLVVARISKLINRERKRRNPKLTEKNDVKLENFLERPVIWGSLFVVTYFTLHNAGVFVDFAFPILALELARTLMHHKLPQVAQRVLNWGLRKG
jgi:CHASE2 domain-containing sensor protein